MKASFTYFIGISSEGNIHSKRDATVKTNIDAILEE